MLDCASSSTESTCFCDNNYLGDSCKNEAYKCQPESMAWPEYVAKIYCEVANCTIICNDSFSSSDGATKKQVNCIETEWPTELKCDSWTNIETTE